MNKLISMIIFFALIISCGPKKEKKKDKFEFKRTQVEEKNDVIDDNEDQIKIVLNSYDNMMYDKKTIEVKPGKNIILTLNHKGKIAKEFMGHNFVLLKKVLMSTNLQKKPLSLNQTIIFQTPMKLLLSLGCLEGENQQP